MSSISCLSGGLPASVSASALRMTRNCIASLSVVVAAVDRADLDCDIGHAVVDMQLDEALGDIERGVLARRLDHRVTADHFLGLGERSVGGHGAAAVAVDPRAVGGA